MKGRLALFLLIITAGAAFSSCEDNSGIKEFNYPDSETWSLLLTPTKLTLKEGTSSDLSYRIIPWNSASNAQVEWSSTNNEVATVDENGRVYAHTPGEADIKLTYKETTAVCHVTVVSSRIAATGITFEQDWFSAAVGQTVTAKAALEPANSTDGISWESTDETVAEVNSDGEITIKGEGYADIIARAGDCSGIIRVLGHGKLWLEQVDPLYKPVSFEYFPFEKDTIRVARGETACIQMIGYAAANQGASVSCYVSKFAPKGTTEDLKVLEPSLYWVREITCNEHWDGWAGGKPSDAYPSNKKQFPDPLMPVDEYKVSMMDGSKQALYIEFDIPRDFAPGIYEGVANLQGNDHGSLPFVVEVYNVTLPEKQTLDVDQWINMNLSAMNNGESTEMYQVYNWFENIIVPFVSRYGQNTFNLQYARVSNRKLIKNAKGEFEMTANFNDWGKEIEMYYRACPDLHYVQGNNLVASVAEKGNGILVILGIGLNPDGSIKATDNGDGTYDFEYTYVDQAEQYSAEADTYFSLYSAALSKYLKSHFLPDGRSYDDVYLQTICDEPNDIVAPAYDRLASYIKHGAPDLKTMDPLGTHNINPDLLDFPCPCIDVMKGEKGYEYADNQTPWLYHAMGPQGEGLNRFIRIPLYKTRLIHWLNYRYHTVGFLHWGLNYWEGAPDGDPWKNASGSYLGGDMWIIWPGYQTVYPSIRLVAMRDGIRDYELLRMYEDQFGRAAADAICGEIVTDCWTYNRDPKAIRKQRKIILDSLAGK